MPLDELLRFTAEEVTELLKEMKVGVIARRRITEEHALELERLWNEKLEAEFADLEQELLDEQLLDISVRTLPRPASSPVETLLLASFVFPLFVLSLSG